MARHLTGPSNCIVGMTDGKFAAVLESCDAVKRLLEAAPAPP